MKPAKGLAQLPEGLEAVPVRIIDSSGAELEGTMSLKRWTPKERQSRALRRTGKILGTIFLISLIGLFVHILLLVIVPALIIALLAAAPLYARFSKEDITFFKVVGKCPYCGSADPLRPYLDTQVREKVTAQCSSCGQTSQVAVPPAVLGP